MSNELQTVNPQKGMSAFSAMENFEAAQRMAKALAESELVPSTYRGKLANCLVALEVAQRCQASPLAVMQHLNLIHGRPSWSSQYIIGAINSCGRFAPLRFKVTGEGDQKTCVAWTTDKSGEILEGPPVSIAMAKAEGWFSRKDKNGNETSKWQTMPDLMLRYRSAAFFGRLYAPEILLGMRTDDEEREIIDVSAQTTQESKAPAQSINDRIKARKKAPEEPKSAPQADTPPEAAAVKPEPSQAPQASVLGSSHF